MYAILDIETIQRDRVHACVLKLYILSSDGITDCEQEFTVCLPLQKLEKKYQTAFIYCRNKIHKLDYYPKGLSTACIFAINTLKRFVKRNGIKIVLFKGGIIERQLCTQAGIKYFDIDKLVLKANCHDPRIEERLHFEYLVLNCKEEIETILSQ